MHDDPAARLHELLRSFRSDTNHNSTIRQSWAAVLGIPDTDLTSLFRGLAGIVTLPAQVRSEIQSLRDVNHDLLLKTLPSIEDALRWTSSLDGQSAELRNKITDSALYGLELCSDALQRRRRRELPEDAEVAALLSDVADLMDAILATSIPPEVQELLLHSCRDLQIALQQIRVFGSDSVQDAVTHGIGAAVVTHVRFNDATTSEDAHSLMERFWSVIGRAADLTTIGTGAAMIGAEVLKALH